MIFAEIVARVREQCPSFVHVDHILTSAATYALPAALITPVQTRADAPFVNMPGAYDQEYWPTVGVYIVIERRQDLAGVRDGAELFDQLCDELRAALVNWFPVGALQPGQYAGGQMAPYEPGVVTWREDFLFRFSMRET